MATKDDVRATALSLPGVVQAEEGFAFSVPHKAKKNGFAWLWNERIEPKRPRVPNHEVIALRVEDEAEKQMLIDSDGEKFFTEPHYNGFPAILVRLPAIERDELAELIVDAWRCVAPAALVREYDERESAKGG